MSKFIFPTNHTLIRYQIEEDGTHNLPTEWLANFIWTGREDYLAWVVEWKAVLHAKIKKIRDAKAIRRDTKQDSDDRQGANNERQQLRIDCCNLMLIRKIGKLKSAEQRALRLAA